eukprot:4076106-Prorocentrum_lima.AAC.1
MPEVMPGIRPRECDVEPHANRKVGFARVSPAGGWGLASRHLHSQTWGELKSRQPFLEGKPKGEKQQTIIGIFPTRIFAVA